MSVVVFSCVDQLKKSVLNKLNMSLLCMIIMSLFMVNTQAAELGDKAIDFNLKTFSGDDFSLSSYRGEKPVYLIFWATWCPICKAEIPKFKELHAKYGDKIEFLAVNVGFEDTLEKAIAYKTDNELPYKVAFDENTVITKEYDVIGTPWQVIIDINGTVRYFSNYTPENLGEHIDDLLKVAG